MLEGVEHVLCWQFAVDQEVRHLQKGGFLGELFDGIPAVTQDSFVAVNESEPY